MTAANNHDHDGHDHGDHSGRATLATAVSERRERRLWLALGLNTWIVVVQVVFGVVAHSLGLLADAGHNLTDVAAILVSVIALRWARRRPTPHRSFGYHRATILAAQANAVSILAITLFILYEGVRRLIHPAPVTGRIVVIVALIAAAANLAGALAVRESHAGHAHGGEGEDLNMRSAMLHLAGDAAASLGVAGAGAVILITGSWFWLDPLVSMAIGVLLAVQAWKLLRATSDILLESTPVGINMDEVTAAIAFVVGVEQVHDLHVWSLSSEVRALSAHIVLDGHRPSKKHKWSAPPSSKPSGQGSGSPTPRSSLNAKPAPRRAIGATSTTLPPVLATTTAIMNSPVADAARLVLFPIGAAAIGAVIAAVRRLSDQVSGFVQHFAAGVVFAAVAGEVLPSLRDQHSLRAVLIGFSIGVATVVALGTYERHAETHDATKKGLPTALLAAIVIDLLIDGLLVGMGAALGEGQGRTLTIALTLEVLFLGLSLTAELIDRSISTARAIAIPIATSLAIAAGAIGGASILGGASHATIAAVLAFGAAALLYLVTEELLVEAHETPDTNWHIIAFFAGFIILFAIEG